MRVIQSLAWYFPDSKAGTETYVSQLVRELRRSAIDCTVVAGRDSHQEDSYVYEGVQVFRYPVDTHPAQDQLRRRRPYGGFEVFSEWLAFQKADIYHQHSLTGGCGIHHLRHAKSLGFPTVVTMHMPNCICLRGTMMQRGERACDGKIGLGRCGTCWGMSRGLPGAVAAVTSGIPLSLSRQAERFDLPLFSVLATPAMVDDHKNHLKEISTLVDRIVVISQWLYDGLKINGVPEQKLVLCHSGGPSNSEPASLSAVSTPSLRVGFLGRWAKEKGLHILVSAVKGLRANIPIQLEVYALRGGAQEAAYEASVLQSAWGDSRISFKEPVEGDDVLRTLKTFDLLAIPSQCLETGPLVALEAHAAGIPIVASDLGGLSERIRHEVDGLLLPYDNIDAWQQAFMRLASNRQLLTKLRNGIRPIRTMSDVASSMETIYRDLLAEKSENALNVLSSHP